MAVTAVAVVLVGCGGDQFKDRTARVTVGDGIRGFQVDSCGRDGATVFVVARADDGRVLQAVMGLSADRRRAVRSSTGVTVTTRDGRELSGFGAEAWQRRDRTGDPPGSIAQARLRGSRVQIEGDLQPDNGTDTLERDAEATPFTVDARCDQQ